MPRVEVQSVETKPLDGGLTEVTAVVANPRLTPTHAAADLAHKITPPDLVSIQGEGVKVVLGLWSADRYFVGAKEQKRRPEVMRIANTPGMGAVYIRWLVTGPGPYTVAVRSQKGGTDRRVGP
jgi:hypothetical protein